MIQCLSNAKEWLTFVCVTEERQRNETSGDRSEGTDHIGKAWALVWMLWMLHRPAVNFNSIYDPVSAGERNLGPGWWSLSRNEQYQEVCLGEIMKGAVGHSLIQASSRAPGGEVLLRSPSRQERWCSTGRWNYRWDLGTLEDMCTDTWMTSAWLSNSDAWQRLSWLQRWAGKTCWPATGQRRRLESWWCSSGRWTQLSPR